ncbi:MAG: aminotransferase class I/II-fold pyridoxal phosphate-dependent enzyme, partial [Bacteroidales bacterium]|nr:aminotransferase class I/II-fold pyridoxal phosphate-dependent enzyme [Bacteroidales bacterium]
AALLREAERLRGALDALPGLSALPTRTHFFLCRLDRGRAADLKQWLAEEHGLLIRDAANFEGLDEKYFRIAAQTPEENDLLVAAVRQYLENIVP